MDFSLLIPVFSFILSFGCRVTKNMTDQILTIKDVAIYLKLAEKTVYKLAAEGKLPGFKVGGSWRFKQADIESWIEAKKTNNKNNSGG
jgi:excisionase family DNA binding protein